MNVSNADPLLGIGAIRQIGQQQGGGIRQGEAVNRLFAVPACRFQRLREQKHAADLRAAVDIAEMHVLPRHIDAYARADALLVDPRAGGDGDDCAIEQEKPRGEHAAGGERQADDGEGQRQFAGAKSMVSGQRSSTALISRRLVGTTKPQLPQPGARCSSSKKPFEP